VGADADWPDFGSGPKVTGAAIGVVAFLVTLCLTPLVIVMAARLGIVDRPGPLKPQSRPVPYLGGVAVFVGLAVGIAAGHPMLIAPVAVALCLGVADDRFDLSALSRLVGQIAVGAVVVATCPVHLPGALAIVSIIAVTVVVINGVNLIDGLDLLAAGVTAVAGVGFAVILHGTAREVAVALTAALAGFLFYNRPPARVYLGDGGSYLLGTALTVLLVESWRPGVPEHVGVAALALVAVPVAEVTCAVLRRARSHQSLTAGDRGHPYDRLVALGWPPTSASLTYIGMEALLVAGVVVAVHQQSMKASVGLDIIAAALLMVAAAATGALHPDQEARR
jgi:UDP-GlcNAc:undecaprenyl-phosphate/decaprenyl-phosphate GlcNAc-1-phosphate transferase